MTLYGIDLAEDDFDSDLEWHESDGMLDSLLAESWRVKATLKGENVLQRLDVIKQGLGATQMCCDTLLRRSDELHCLDL